MNYKPLKTLFHMYGWENVETEYEMRRNSFSSYLININIHPIQNGEQKTETCYPLFFVLTKELASNLESILTNSEKIKQLSSKLPGVANDSYINHLLINELQSTNETENIRSTKEEIAESINKTKGYNKRFDGLVNQYLMIENNNIEINSISDIRKIFDSIVSGEIKENDLPDGDLFRRKGIGVYDESKNKWIHRNEYTEPELFEHLTLMLEFVKYFDAPQVYKIMASHFIFEYLHPFYDGNGRVGRYIIAKMLNDSLDPFTALTFSYTVNNNKSKYYKAFENTSNYYNKGELTNFIKEMLDLLLKGQSNIIETFEKNNSILDKLGIALTNVAKNRYDFDILFVLLQDKVFGSKYSRISLKKMQEVTSFSRNKINEVIKEYETKLIKIKSNPVVYEIDDKFIEELLSQK
ncbi:cell filamentation protein Fic [Staphylococcus equorum]|uniref:Fic family protein n=1 Tax=Staphylococcus equorum TaxID=246432 RepID=UPI000852C33E|nr:Fic family protein [Staphylococcus equorum]MDK9843591.1 Fic family protein [Staphylococcus equorum]MDK9870233.1 Fic family protein [Staphylococcus equorum]OEK65341.1 cell filamentation protein Fic [Staphylococcus equorum]OEK70805.1 cell filamentation protein Fic [Staphylococcus equorum]